MGNVTAEKLREFCDLAPEVRERVIGFTSDVSPSQAAILMLNESLPASSTLTDISVYLGADGQEHWTKALEALKNAFETTL